MLDRYQSTTLRLLPAGATVAGWDIFLPLDRSALFTAHAGLAASSFLAIYTVRASLGPDSTDCCAPAISTENRGALVREIARSRFVEIEVLKAGRADAFNLKASL